MWRWILPCLYVALAANISPPEPNLEPAKPTTLTYEPFENKAALQQTLEFLYEFANGFHKPPTGNTSTNKEPSPIADKVRAETESLHRAIQAINRMLPDADNHSVSLILTDTIPFPKKCNTTSLEASLVSLFETTEGIGILLQEYGTPNDVVAFLNTTRCSLAQNLSASPPRRQSFSVVVNRKLADMLKRFRFYAPARELYQAIVESGVYTPSFHSSVDETNEYAAVMYSLGQLVSGVGLRGLNPPADQVLEGKQHIFVALETYRATLNPRYAAIMEELAGEHVSRGLNMTTLPIVIQYFSLALDYLALPGVNMTGSANYNAILGQYYLATATQELEHHYHLLRTLRHRSAKPWTHSQLTRSAVQHSKLEAVKSLVRVQKRYFDAVHHFRRQDLGLMAADYQYDTVNSFRMCFFEVCKQGSQIAKTLDVVLQLEEAKSEPTVRGVVQHELVSVSGRGGMVFELDETHTLLSADNNLDAAAKPRLTPVHETVAVVFHGAYPASQDMIQISNETLELLTMPSQNSETIPAQNAKHSLVSSHIPDALRVRLLQEGYREQFLDNYHRYVVPTLQRLEALQRSFPWLRNMAASQKEDA